jgi:hypothetical protein
MDVGCAELERIAEVSSCSLRLLSDADPNPLQVACRDCRGLAQFSRIAERGQKLLSRRKLRLANALSSRAPSARRATSVSALTAAFAMAHAKFGTDHGGHLAGHKRASCCSIIDAHEGRLWATAAESTGAVFAFTLPVWLRYSGRRRRQPRSRSAPQK